MEDLKSDILELLLDKLALESFRFEDLEIEQPASNFPGILDELCARNLPAVFRGASPPEVPAASLIIEELCTENIDIAVTPTGLADAPLNDQYFAKPHIINKPLSWLLERIEEGPGTKHYYFQSQDDNLHKLRQCSLPKTLTLPTKLLGSQQAANLWIGTGGTTSRLHSDNYDNIYVQMKGTKRVYLMPPTSILDVEEKYLKPATYNENMDLVPDFDDLENNNNQTEIHDDVTAFIRHVLFPTYNPAAMSPKSNLYIIDLKEGDVLFLPALWYHQLEILGSGVNMSLNFWYTPFEDERRWAEWNFARQIVQRLKREQ